MLQFGFTFTEQDLYDKLIKKIEEKVAAKKNQKEIIEAVDNLINELMNGDY